MCRGPGHWTGSEGSYPASSLIRRRSGSVPAGVRPDHKCWQGSGLGARSQAGTDPGMGTATLSPDIVVPIWQFGVQHCQAPNTGQPVNRHCRGRLRYGIAGLLPWRPSPPDPRMVPGAGGVPHGCHPGLLPFQSPNCTAPKAQTRSKPWSGLRHTSMDQRSATSARYHKPELLCHPHLEGELPFGS